MDGRRRTRSMSQQSSLSPRNSGREKRRRSACSVTPPAPPTIPTAISMVTPAVETQEFDLLDEMIDKVAAFKETGDSSCLEPSTQKIATATVVVNTETLHVATIAQQPQPVQFRSLRESIDLVYKFSLNDELQSSTAAATITIAEPQITQSTRSPEPSPMLSSSTAFLRYKEKQGMLASKTTSFVPKFTVRKRTAISSSSPSAAQSAGKGEMSDSHNNISAPLAPQIKNVASLAISKSGVDITVQNPSTVDANVSQEKGVDYLLQNLSTDNVDVQRVNTNDDQQKSPTNMSVGEPQEKGEDTNVEILHTSVTKKSDGLFLEKGENQSAGVSLEKGKNEGNTQFTAGHASISSPSSTRPDPVQHSPPPTSPPHTSAPPSSSHPSATAKVLTLERTVHRLKTSKLRLKEKLKTARRDICTLTSSVDSLRSSVSSMSSFLSSHHSDFPSSS